MYGGNCYGDDADEYPNSALLPKNMYSVPLMLDFQQRLHERS